MANPPILTKKMSVFCRFPRKENFEVFENFVIFDEKYISKFTKIYLEKNATLISYKNGVLLTKNAKKRQNIDKSLVIRRKAGLR